MLKIITLIASFTISGLASSAQVRIKDIVTVRGVRLNQLNGFGLVVGLPASGDSAGSVPTQQAYAAMMHGLGINVPNNILPTQNIASVMVTAELPPFARIGDRLDIKVSAIGDAKSLAGGTLIMSPLKGADGQIYGMGQGAIVISDGALLTTVGRVPQGATIEKDFAPKIDSDGTIYLSLKNEDFTNSTRVVDRINSYFRGFYAESVDSGAIKVLIPDLYQGRTVEFLSELEALKIDIDMRARVVINQQSGTIVIGNEVRVSPVSISHGELTVNVSGQGDKKEKSLSGLTGSTVGEMVKGLNAMGVKPKDLVSIFQAVARAGALHGDIELM
jgi:flagellar P-ring protein FlgI